MLQFTRDPMMRFAGFD